MALQNAFDAAAGGARSRDANAHTRLGHIQSTTLVFDSGLVRDDPRIVALHEGYDDLVKIFDAGSVIC